MAPLYVIFAIFLQAVVINCENTTITDTSYDDKDVEILPTYEQDPFLFPINEFEPEVEENEHVIEDYSNGSNDFYDVLFGTNGKFTGNSASMMEQVTSDKTMTPDAQVEEIKKVASKISSCIQNEMINFLTYLTAGYEKEESVSRKKRDTETPMDSMKCVMRFLKHMKSTNEHQNMAIEQMLSAEELAEKFHIKYEPDMEVLEQIAASSQKKSDEVHAVLDGMTDKDVVKGESSVKPDDYNHYDVDDIETHKDEPIFVHIPPQHLFPAPQCTYTFGPRYETQMRPPPVRHHPVSHRPPAFYEPHPFTPAPPKHHPVHHESHSVQHQPHPVQHPIDDFPVIVEIEIIDPEPELVGEEFEEMISSKVTVDKGDEPECADETDIDEIITNNEPNEEIKED